MMEAEVKLRVFTFAKDCLSWVFFVSKVEGVLTVYVFAEVLRQVDGLIDLYQEVHSLAN